MTARYTLRRRVGARGRNGQSEPTACFFARSCVITKSVRRLLFTLALALLLAGCGHDNPLASTNADVSGTWQGVVALGTQRSPLRLSIFQRDIEVTGTWVIGESGGSLGGQVSGASILLSLHDGTACFVNITATVRESKMTGTYAAGTAQCGTTAAGSVELSRL